MIFDRGGMGMVRGVMEGEGVGGVSKSLHLLICLGSECVFDLGGVG